MSTLVTRAGKGSPLTHNEVDTNFTNLNTDKVEKTSAAITGGTIDNTVIGGTTPAAGTFTTLTATSSTTLGTGSTRFWTATGAATTPTFIASGNNAIFGVAGTGTTFIQSSTSTTQFAVSHTASAVNYVQVTGAATGGAINVTAQGSDTNIRANFYSKGTSNVVLGNGAGINFIAGANAGTSANYLTAASNSAGSAPYLAAAGSDTNIDLNLTTKGTGVVNLNTGAGTQVRIIDSGGTAVNRIHLQGQATGFLPVIASRGSDTNLGMSYSTQGTGAHDFYTAGTNFTQQLKVAHTASAVNFLQVQGNATGNAPTISAQGSDANVFLDLKSKGNLQISLYTGGGIQFAALHTASAVNYATAKGSATGFGVVFGATGSDTNIPVVVQPKGTGALQAQLTDSTATGGNARGSRAVDWQLERGSASAVASGVNTFIGGGYGNTASNSISTVAGGQFNIASGVLSSIVGGYANTASGYFSGISSGSTNTAAGILNFIGGGQLNSGTSASSVTTQSATMNATTAVTLAASNASIKVGQLVTGTYLGFPNYVAAISGTSLTLSSAATGSGTATLSFYTPHGIVVGGGNNQATGSYSFIGGGGDAGTAANRNVASGDWSTVVGGRKNTATSFGSFVGGGSLNNATSSQYTAVLGGENNNATGNTSTVGGGYGQVASGEYSFVSGGVVGTTRGISGFHAFPACAFPIALSSGVSQAGLLVLGKQTTDATPTIIVSNSNAASSTNQVILPNNSAYYFKGSVIANVTGGGNTKAWAIEGAIKRGANAASTALVGTPTVVSGFADVGAATWAIAVTADTTNGGLAVTFTGQAATTIRVVAKLETTEVTF